MNDLNNWSNIDNYLFEKYCVEGRDDELCKLMRKHDEEIHNKAIDDFYNKIVEKYEEVKNIPQVEKSTVYVIALGIMQQLKK